METRTELIEQILDIAEELKHTNPIHSYYLTGELRELSKQLQFIDNKISKDL